MGRRALPKIDRSIDISAHHSLLEELACPFVAAQFFNREAPLEIEIGSGKGLFLLNASGKNPTRNYLGVETAKKYAYLTANRFAANKRSNARMISGDGIRFFAEFLSSQSVDVVHVYFPDPWWKERHRRRRVMQAAVVRDIERVLKPTGELHFWTDVEEYFETTLALLAQECSLNGPFEVAELPAENDMDYRTHFERRMRLNDHSVFRTRFTK